MSTVHPSNRECYFLRILLHHKRGPKSFDDLKTIEGEVCQTFQEACIRLGPLHDDSHWNAAMEEAAFQLVPKRIRELFAVILTACEPSNPLPLWENHKESMAEDFLHGVRLANPGGHVDFNETIFNEALIAIEDHVLESNSKLLQDYGLPIPDRQAVNILQREIQRETMYDMETLANQVEDDEPKLNDDQRVAFDQVMAKVQEGGGFLFLDAPGGTGKTFLTNLILAKVRLQGHIALTVASSGIAATLLEGGKTAHSALKLPLDLARIQDPVCNISKGTGKSELLKRCKLIVWDEVTMSHKNAFNILDKTMKDLRENDFLFGGVTVVICGDFRQTLPVVPRGTPADELNACIKAHELWGQVQKLKLTTNMRVLLRGDGDAAHFAALLLKVGNGHIQHDEGTFIKIPDGCGAIVKDKKELIGKVYPNLKDNILSDAWLRDRAILAPKNSIVSTLNDELLQLHPGSSKTCLFMDKTSEESEAVHYPVDFLNSINLTGFPPHVLHLKVGSPIMLLRNLDPPKLCNSTRMVVTKMLHHLIEAKILTGKCVDEMVTIPRISLNSTNSPIEFSRFQFPVKVCFAMTINKSQGQTLNVAGLCLEDPCFSHGQFYVGCSRVASSKNLFILAPKGITKNVVYPAALK